VHYCLYLWDGAQGAAACERRVDHAGGQLEVAHLEGREQRLLLALGKGRRLGILVCRADGPTSRLLARRIRAVPQQSVAAGGNLCHAHEQMIKLLSYCYVWSTKQCWTELPAAPRPWVTQRILLRRPLHAAARDCRH
jgi:hypothetical protein